MDTKKYIKKFKIIKYSVIVLYILAVIAIMLMDSDGFTVLFPNSTFKGIPFWLVLVLVLVATVLYILFYVLMQAQISKILTMKCLPHEYRIVYNALSPKNNKIGNSMVDIVSDFMLGNFEIAKTKAFDVLQTETNVASRQNAYSVLAQIFLITEDKENLIQLSQSASIGVNDKKYGVVYERIVRMATVFIDFLNGDNSTMLEAYSKAREVCKSKCDVYISLYYYAIALIKDGQMEKAIPLFQEMITEAKELFVAKFAKLALITIVTE